MLLNNDDLLRLYRNMVRSRKLDEMGLSLVYGGKCYVAWHSGIGQEAIGAGACTFLRPDDYLLYNIRNITHVLSKGMDPRLYLAEFLGKATGPCGGRGGLHIAAMELGVVGLYGCLGSTFPLAVGLGLAAKRRRADQIVLASFGDGASARGAFHESMLMAAKWRLPVVWMCENNGLQAMVHFDEVWPVKDVADMAKSYGMPGLVVDGQDVVAVAEAVDEAVARARRGEGPSLVECKALRFRPHAEGLPDSRPPDEVAELTRRDPAVLFREKLLAQNVLTEALVKQIDEEAAQEMAEAEKFALESPEPDPSTLLEGVFVG